MTADEILLERDCCLCASTQPFLQVVAAEEDTREAEMLELVAACRHDRTHTSNIIMLESTVSVRRDRDLTIDDLSDDQARSSVVGRYCFRMTCGLQLFLGELNVVRTRKVCPQNLCCLPLVYARGSSVQQALESTMQGCVLRVFVCLRVCLRVTVCSALHNLGRQKSSCMYGQKKEAFIYMPHPPDVPKNDE